VVEVDERMRRRGDADVSEQRAAIGRAVPRSRVVSVCMRRWWLAHRVVQRRRVERRRVGVRVAVSPIRGPDADASGAAGVEDEATIDRQALDKLAAARIWLTKERPLLGVLARPLRPVIARALTAPLAVLPDDRLLVQPELALRTPFPQLCARVAHVTLHAALGGFARRRSRPLARWNLAHDLAIDPLVRASGLESDYAIEDVLVAELPASILAGPASVKGGSIAAETADAALATIEMKSNEQATPLPVPNAEWIDLLLAPPDDVPPDDPQEAQPETKVDPSLGVTGKGAVPLPGDGAGIGDVADGEGSTPSPQGAGAVTWRSRLADAIATDRAAGSPTWGRLPEWAREWIEATIEPPPNWNVALQHAVAMLARAQRSYLRPSRRSAAIGWDADVRLAGRRVVPAGQLAAVIDTSGSIDEPTLRRALGSIASAATAEGLDEIRLVQADAEVTDDRIYAPSDLLRAPISIVGRGGTRFGPALELVAIEARKRGERAGVVYLTDLEGEFPDAAVARFVDVLWVTYGTNVAPFGKTVHAA
jgi:predicted metal-dependent peptidase